MTIASEAAQRASSERVPPAKVPISTIARGRRSSTISSRARSSSRYCKGETTTPRQLKVNACSTASFSVSPRLARRWTALAIDMRTLSPTATTGAIRGLRSLSRSPVRTGPARSAPRRGSAQTDARSPSHPPVARPYSEYIAGKRAEAADPQNSVAAPALSSRHRAPHGCSSSDDCLWHCRPAAESGARPIGRDVLNLRNGVAMPDGELEVQSAASMHTRRGGSIVPRRPA